MPSARQELAGAAAIARAFLALARHDIEGVADAVAAVRAEGRSELLGRYDWRILEIDALIGLGRLGQAETALAELEAALSPAGPPSALVAAARLRGDLAAAAGRHPAAAAAFEAAWRGAQDLRVPLALAQLEISDARRLRAACEPQVAVARLRSARQRLTTFGAIPFVEDCDRELAAVGAPVEPETAPAFVGLTPAEQAVARLVAAVAPTGKPLLSFMSASRPSNPTSGTSSPSSASESRQDLITGIGCPREDPVRAESGLNLGRGRRHSFKGR